MLQLNCLLFISRKRFTTGVNLGWLGQLTTCWAGIRTYWKHSKLTDLHWLGADGMSAVCQGANYGIIKFSVELDSGSRWSWVAMLNFEIFKLQHRLKVPFLRKLEVENCIIGKTIIKSEARLELVGVWYNFSKDNPSRTKILNFRSKAFMIHRDTDDTTMVYWTASHW